MDKLEYLKLRNDIITRLGKPEYGIDRTDAVNESAKELAKLYSAYKSKQMTERHASNRQALDVKEQKEVIKEYKHIRAVPIELSENDLAPFTDTERPILIDYFRDTNQTPKDLERTGFSSQRIVALMRSGPFTVLAARVFEYLMPIEVRNAALKAIRDGDKRLIERFAEQTGVLKNQEMNLNINKPIQDDALMQKLKELGDAQA